MALRLEVHSLQEATVLSVGLAGLQSSVPPGEMAKTILDMQARVNDLLGRFIRTGGDSRGKAAGDTVDGVD